MPGASGEFSVTLTTREEKRDINRKKVIGTKTKDPPKPGARYRLVSRHWGRLGLHVWLDAPKRGSGYHFRPTTWTSLGRHEMQPG